MCVCVYVCVCVRERDIGCASITARVCDRVHVWTAWMILAV